MAFREVKVAYWVPSKEGEQIIGLVAEGGEVDTIHGAAEYVTIHEWNIKTGKATGVEQNVLISGGLHQLPKQMGKLVRITFNGEKENPNPKRGRSKFYKDYTVEVDDEYFEAK